MGRPPWPWAMGGRGSLADIKPSVCEGGEEEEKTSANAYPPNHLIDLRGGEGELLHNILTPEKTVKYLGAVSNLSMRIRRFGIYLFNGVLFTFACERWRSRVERVKHASGGGAGGPFGHESRPLPSSAGSRLGAEHFRLSTQKKKSLKNIIIYLLSKIICMNICVLLWKKPKIIYIHF